MNERFRIVNALVLASATLVSVSAVRAQEGIWIDAKPVEGEINTNKNENLPGISGDGLTMYFMSSPPGEDIWVARRASPEAPFEPAVKLEGEVNTKRWSEWFPRVSADGLTLYFTSDRPGGLGEIDICMATRATPSDEFGNVTNNLGPGIIFRIRGIGERDFRKCSHLDNAAGEPCVALRAARSPRCPDQRGRCQCQRPRCLPRMASGWSETLLHLD